MYVAHILREDMPSERPDRTVCGMTLPIRSVQFGPDTWRFLGYADPNYVRDESGQTLADIGRSPWLGRSMFGRWMAVAHLGCENCWMNYRVARVQQAS